MDNRLTEYVIDHSRKRDKELKYDFMPDLLEIIERPAHKAGTVIIVGFFTLLVVAVIWACLSKIDVVVTAGGSVQPEGNINVVKAYAGGIVKSINVNEGAFVKKGDTLINLSTESIDVDGKQLEYQKKILEIQKKIYNQISKGEDVSKLNIDEYADELQPYVKAITDSDVSYRNTLASLKKENDTAELNKKIAEIQLEEYNKKGSDNQKRIQKLTVDQYQAAIDEVNLKIKDETTQYSARINSKITELDDQLDKINADLEKFRLSKQYQKITAPADGYVNSIAVNTVGQTVGSTEELATIVPEKANLEMFCYVKNMDIADIKKGMKTEIKLEAYPYTKYGTVKGRVVYISPSSFVNEKMGSIYLVKVKITEIPDGIDVVSGLSGNAEIKIGKRSIMDYFLDPIKKGFGESLKEK